MPISLPNYVLQALNTLETAGFEAFCVGGAIRDAILGKQPFDFDITTNASPQDIINIFEKTVPTGIKHGTVTVVIDKQNIEVTTYRSEGGYSDHRSPDSVSFLSSVEGDVMRRDFTMNAVLYNPKSGFYDPQNGMIDIENKIIRAVGDPLKRFNEDALRIMRAFRFASQLGFILESKTKSAAMNLAHLVSTLSAERIYGEFKKIIISDHPQYADELLQSGALGAMKVTLTEDESLVILNALPKIFALRFAFLCNTCNFDAKSVLKLMKSDSETVLYTEKYCGLLKEPTPTNHYELKILLNRYGLDAVETIIDCGDVLWPQAGQLKAILHEITEQNQVYQLKDLNINGNDLLNLGLKGEDIGRCLAKLLDCAMLDPTINIPEKLSEIAKDYK